MVKIDLDKLPMATPEEIERLQVAVSVMCGGGMLGAFAARQPADFYIDSRVGRLPYGKKQIYQAVQVLAELAKMHGFDPQNLGNCPDFPACGVFGY